MFATTLRTLIRTAPQIARHSNIPTATFARAFQTSSKVLSHKHSLHDRRIITAASRKESTEAVERRKHTQESTHGFNQHLRALEGALALTISNAQFPKGSTVKIPSTIKKLKLDNFEGKIDIRGANALDAIFIDGVLFEEEDLSYIKHGQITTFGKTIFIS